MSIFDGLSSIYDRGMLPLEWLVFRRLRRRVFPSLHGSVLELGVGTGINLPLYEPGARVTGCDASGEMLAWAGRRLTQGRVKFTHDGLFRRGSARLAPWRAAGAVGAHAGQRRGRLADGRFSPTVARLEPGLPPEPGDGLGRGGGGVPGAAG